MRSLVATMVCLSMELFTNNIVELDQMVCVGDEPNPDGLIEDAENILMSIHQKANEFYDLLRLYNPTADEVIAGLEACRYRLSGQSLRAYLDQIGASLHINEVSESLSINS